MTREEAVWYVNHTFEIIKEELCNSGRFDEAKEFEIAQNMAIEALSVVCDDCIWHVCNYNKVDWDGHTEEDVTRLLSLHQPTGRWIFEPKDAIELMFTKPKCSKCGFESADGGNFCPNCGADMRGEQE